MEDSLARSRLERLFHDALEQRPEDRHSFLAGACDDNAELREQVLALITAFEQETGFLETPVLESAGPSVSQMLCSLGQVLGHYRILRLIGQGGMGDVYLAEDNTLGRKVALKLLPMRMSALKATLARFWLEARTASALNHPNIMTVYEIGDEQGLHYIAAEYVEGSTVRQLLANGPLSLSQVLNIALQVAGGLMAAHAAGIIHRDIKPENIMVRPDGYVKILDFGLAKLTENGMAMQNGVLSGQNMATVPGILLGTVGYMSPEQARGLDLDARSDLFSLGTVIYEMASGKCPFTGKTPSDALISILHEEPPAMAEAAPSSSPELAGLASKLLSKDREKRYQSAEELIVDLKKLQSQLSAKAGKKETAEATSHPLQRKSTLRRGAMISIALVLLGLATAVALRLHFAGDGGEHRQDNQQVVQQKWGFNSRLRLPANVGQEEKEIVLPAKAPLKFAAGQQFRLYFSSPNSGYLYILDQAPRTADAPVEFVTLFPSPTANSDSPFVSARQEIKIPQESWLTFMPGKGTEKLWLVWSGRSLPMLDGLEKYANDHDHGQIPSGADEQAIKNFLEANYKPEDLDSAATSIVAARGENKMLVWRMDLTH